MAACLWTQVAEGTRAIAAACPLVTPLASACVLLDLRKAFDSVNWRHLHSSAGR